MRELREHEIRLGNEPVMVQATPEGLMAVTGADDWDNPTWIYNTRLDPLTLEYVGLAHNDGKDGPIFSHQDEVGWTDAFRKSMEVEARKRVMAVIAESMDWDWFVDEQWLVVKSTTDAWVGALENRIDEAKRELAEWRRERSEVHMLCMETEERYT